MIRRLAHVVAAVVTGAMLAAGGAAAQTGGGVPFPVLPKATGEQCVEDTEIMRREHMNLLLRQRDETMRDGIRGGKYSLRACVQCHAAPDPAPHPGGAPTGVRTIKGFCVQCHEYAAVRIDCFQCHSETAEEASR